MSNVRRLFAALIAASAVTGAARAAEVPSALPSPSASATPDPGPILLKLQDGDPSVRAAAIDEASRLSPPNLALAAAMTSLAENPGETMDNRWKAICAVGMQGTFYAADAVRLGLRLAVDSGLPESARGSFQNAIIRQGDPIIPDVENALQRGAINMGFFRAVMYSINTPEAQAANARQGDQSFETRRRGIDRHVNPNR